MWYRHTITFPNKRIFWITSIVAKYKTINITEIQECCVLLQKYIQLKGAKKGKMLGTLNEKRMQQL